MFQFQSCIFPFGTKQFSFFGLVPGVKHVGHNQILGGWTQLRGLIMIAQLIDTFNTYLKKSLAVFKSDILLTRKMYLASFLL